MALEKTWQSINELDEKKLQTNLRQWLIFPGSFMGRLKEHGIFDGRIEVLSETWETVEEEEASILQMAHASSALIREVLIQNNFQQWMFARTVIPRETLTDQDVELGQLENRAIGTVLFKDNRWQREKFTFSYLSPHSKIFQKIAQQISLSAPGLWARRAPFCLKEKKLLLTEVFLPNSENLP